MFITVECKVMGRSRPITPDWSIGVPPEWQGLGGRLTLRDLIRRVVREEVSGFQARQQERRLIQILTERQIEQAVARGKVISGGSDLDQTVDPEAAVAAALLAFVDGLFFVFLDDEQKTELDSPISLKSDSHLTFLRLVALVGG